MQRACAIMAVYNEADIVREAVDKLIAQGVDVYLIDNASTDGTAERVADRVGRGLVDIETARFCENGREVYDWTALLKLKEALSRRLGYDWYLHVDADEIRYAPWPGVSLREGLDRVDAAGYNLVNFKLFNFRLTEATVVDPSDVESSMTLYSGTERYNQRQVKAWKADPAVDIAVLGGHHIQVPKPRVYPIRFIHKHYPVRSLAHGRRKILAERKARFSEAEKARGWHVQYDHLAEVDPKDVFWDPATLTPFDFERESHALFVESSQVLSETLGEGAEPLDEAGFVPRWFERLVASGVEQGHATQLISVASNLVQMLAQQDLPPIAASRDDTRYLRRLVGAIARLRYLNGDPLLYGRLAGLRFQEEVTA
jgi:hypothetical protein